ncbi:hypothetical protein DMB66_37965 [Actinoplanes sp. ATCC 53533]|nr:hypothetical protein DMB66_37965 [Actinoplanes sp. ATCC 53533]
MPVRWQASVTPDGLPVVYWCPTAPVAQVVRFPGPLGSGDERLVDVLSETMQSRGAQVLREKDMMPDCVATLWPLGDWYGQVSAAGELTVWMPGTWQQRGHAEAARVPLCTMRGLDPGWVEAARSEQRILLAMRPPATAKPDLPEALLWKLFNPVNYPADIDRPGPFGATPEPVPVPARSPDPVGGIVAVGTVPDDERKSVKPRRVPIRRSVSGPPIEVGSLWTAAQDRAQQLVDASRADPCQTQRAPTDGSVLLIALVLTALSREQDRQPGEVALADVATRLANRAGDLWSWLDVMLQPTTVADDLRRAATLTTGYGSWRDLSPRRLLEDLDGTRAVVERRWLIDGGGLRLGDRALWVPHPEDPQEHVRLCQLRDVGSSTWPDSGRRTGAIAAVVGVDCEEKVPRWRTDGVAYWDLLAADDSTARAVVQAAYSAGVDLWFARQHLDGDDLNPADDPLRVWKTLHARAQHHTIPAVRQVLDTVLAANDIGLRSAMTSGIVQLQALAPLLPIPGAPVGEGGYTR